jgi:hypothetical protein
MMTSALFNEPANLSGNIPVNQEHLFMLWTPNDGRGKLT